MHLFGSVLFTTSNLSFEIKCRGRFHATTFSLWENSEPTELMCPYANTPTRGVKKVRSTPAEHQKPSVCVRVCVSKLTKEISRKEIKKNIIEYN